MKELKGHFRDSLLAMQTLRRERLLCDLTLVFDDDRAVAAHKLVLAAASPFFKRILTDPLLGSPSTIKVQGASAEVGQLLVNFAYTANLDLRADNLMLILDGAEKLGFKQVETLCLEALAKSSESVVFPEVASSIVVSEDAINDPTAEAILPLHSPEKKAIVQDSRAGDGRSMKRTEQPGLTTKQTPTPTIFNSLTIARPNDQDITSTSDVVKSSSKKTECEKTLSPTKMNSSPATKGQKAPDSSASNCDRNIGENEKIKWKKSKASANFAKKLENIEDYESRASLEHKEILTLWRREPTRQRNVSCAICGQMCDGNFLQFVDHIFLAHPINSAASLPVSAPASLPLPASLPASAKTRQKKPHSCPQCGKLFKFKQNLSLHRRNEHAITYPTFSCGFCGKSGFASRQSRRDHEDLCENNETETHLKRGQSTEQRTPDSVPCEKCDVFFSSVEILKRHWTRVHKRNQKVACHLCGREINKLHMLAHVRSIHMGVKEKPQPCGECGKLYNRAAMRIHKNRDHRGVRFKCPECPATQSVLFPTQIMLRRHREAVHQRRRFRCAVCGAEFVDKCSWRTHHLADHEGLRHPCQLCGKQFKRAADRKQHVAEVHEGKRWTCAYCPKSYSQNGNLLLHVKAVHLGIYGHKCPHCGKGFTRPSIMRDHVSKEHGD